MRAGRTLPLMKLLWFTLIVECVLFWSALSFLARPNAGPQMLLTLTILVMVVVWPAVLVSLFRTQARTYRLRAAALLLLAPASLVLAVNVSGPVRDYLFYRDLPQMKKVVSLIVNGTLPVPKEKTGVPVKYKESNYETRAERDSSGALTVEFLVGGGFPVKHYAYLYRSDGVLTRRITSFWPASRRREPQWFEVSD